MGVDVIATKGSERLAVQAKMYGGSTRLVNRECLMQLHGAAAYFDCTSAVLATNGGVMPDARAVADKLGIRILELNRANTSRPATGHGDSANDFDAIWHSKDRTLRPTRQAPNRESRIWEVAECSEARA